MVKIETVYNKIESIERRIQQIKQYLLEINEPFATDYKSQDAIILNLQRACETSIDLAMHICSRKKLGLPTASKEAFEILEKNHILTKFASEAMQKLVGFRNVAIHEEYQPLNLNILCSIMKKYLTGVTDYTKEIIKFLKLETGL